jgi:hypothetical protein
MRLRTGSRDQVLREVSSLKESSILRVRHRTLDLRQVESQSDQS